MQNLVQCSVGSNSMAETGKRKKSGSGGVIGPIWRGLGLGFDWDLRGRV